MARGGGSTGDEHRDLTRTERNLFSLTRRRLLGAGAASLVTALAGCGGDGDGGGGATATRTETVTATETLGEDATETETATATETATPTEVQGEPLEATFAHESVHAPETSNWQPFHAKWPGETMAMYLHEGSQVYLDGRIQLVMVDDWSYDPEEGVKEITIRDDMTWWNGAPVMIDDLWRELEIRRLFNPEGSDIKRYEKVDDHTVRHVWKDDVQTPSTSLMEKTIGGNINTRRDVLKRWHEELRDAANQQERDSISEAMGSEWEITTQEFIDKGLGYGPWQMVEFSSQEFIGEQWDQHPFVQSGKVNIPRHVQRVSTEEAKLNLMIKNDQLDGAWDDPLPRELQGAAPDHIQTVSRFGFPWISQLNINWKGPATPVLQDRNVRRAMACIFDTELAVTNNNDRGFPIKTQTGMDPTFNEDWLGQEFVDSLIQYPYKTDHEQADQYLAKSPYSKKNGEVVDEDGDQVAFTFIAQNYFHLSPAETAAAQLDEYGFKVEFEALPWQQMEAITIGDEATMEYDLHVQSHYAGINFHPIDYYWPSHIFGHRLAFTTDELEQWYEEGRELSPLNAKPLTPTIPEEVGAEEVTGSGVDLPWLDLWRELKFEADRERAEEICRLFARYWNYDVPGYDILQTELGAWGDVKHWDWPEKNSKAYELYHNVQFNLKWGDIRAKYEQQ